MAEMRQIPNSWNEVLSVNSPLIFGILNLTPDSFSDGGEYSTREQIHSRIDELIAQGSHAIDVGAESTRPGASEVPPEDQLDRVNYACEYSRENGGNVLFSIDTRCSQVAQRAISDGFSIINDVSAGRYDPKMFETMASSNALCILMHSRGTPDEMQKFTQYDDIVLAVENELHEQISCAIKYGVNRDKIMVDPGIGFAKTPEQSLELIGSIDKFKRDLGLPVMVGVSRKTVVSFVASGDAYMVPFKERDPLSAELGVALVRQGVDALRVHNVELMHSLLGQGK